MNPLIPHVFAADPAARVWNGDDRLWIYASHDEPLTNTHDSMRSYHAFSSRDLVHWTDHGVVLHLDSVAWASSHMWAIDCVYRHGRYVLVYCAVERATGLFRTGLATSVLPEGPFTDTGFIEGVDHGQDPAVLIDDDDVPYLYWGSGFNMHACRLTDDLRKAVDGTYVRLSEQLTWSFEGPWLHKHGGRYYLSYPGLLDRQWPERMYYATADHPLGPFTFQGEYIPRFAGQAGTNHGSITYWKDRWLAFHHSMWHSNVSTRRSVMCDELVHEADGRIRPIVPTPAGVTGLPSKVRMLLEAENGPASLGTLTGVRVARDVAGFTGNGYVHGFDCTYHGFTVVAQVAHPCRARLVLRYHAPDADEALAIMVNTVKLDGDAPDGTHDNWVSRYALPRTTAWTDRTIADVDLVPGDNVIRVYRGPQCTGGALVDHVALDLLEIRPAYTHA